MRFAATVMCACAVATAHGAAVRVQTQQDNIDDAVAQLMTPPPPLPLVGKMREGDAAVMHTESWAEPVNERDAPAGAVKGMDGKPVVMHTKTWIEPTPLNDLRKPHNATVGGGDGPGMIEVGRVHVSTRAVPPEVYFFKTEFEEPPVVVVQLQEYPNCWNWRANQLTVRIEDVTTKSFRATLVFSQWGGAIPALSYNVAYMAVTPGVHRFPDGRVIEAGRLSTKSQMFGGHQGCSTTKTRAAWDRIAFQHTEFKDTPAVFANIQTMNNEEHNVPLMVSRPWLEVARGHTNSSHAQFALERTSMSDNGDVKYEEEIGYVAIPYGSHERTYGGYEVLTRNVRDNTHDQVLFPAVREARPLTFANQATRNIPDGGTICHQSYSNSATDINNRANVIIVRQSRCFMSSWTPEAVDFMAWTHAFHMKLNTLAKE